MRRGGLALLVIVTLAAASPAAEPREGVHQDAPRLTWLTPGFLPPDGLVTAGMALSRYSPEYDPTGSPAEYSVVQARLYGHWTPWPGVALSVGQNLRAWSNYLPNPAWPSADAGASGLGLADGDWRLAVAVPGLPDWLGLVGYAGSNLAVGGEDLGEGATSPEAGATLSLRVWRDHALPEMRLHVSYGRRWNRNEETGFGANLGPGPQPWYPQYPDAASSGGEANNDVRVRGAGLEFRGGTTALWLEY
ncbi:hypothetical protein GF314_13385, partial [bacterium]|nr:hypothetical protein [bacterium]